MAHDRMSDSAPLYALLILIAGVLGGCALVYFAVRALS